MGLKENRVGTAQPHTNAYGKGQSKGSKSQQKIFFLWVKKGLICPHPNILINTHTLTGPCGRAMQEVTALPPKSGSQIQIVFENSSDI